MSEDLLDNLLEVEHDFYQQGFEEGIADSAYAGLVEGKLFGIEKGFSKGVELGKLRGRALLWQARLSPGHAKPQAAGGGDQGNSTEKNHDANGSRAVTELTLPLLENSSRLQKNIDSLVSLTASSDLNRSNTDEAVEKLDQRISRAGAKAKVIATVINESLDPTSSGQGSIEDAAGLQARH